MVIIDLQCYKLFQKNEKSITNIVSKRFGKRGH